MDKLSRPSQVYLSSFTKATQFGPSSDFKAQEQMQAIKTVFSYFLFFATCIWTEGKYNTRILNLEFHSLLQKWFVYFLFLLVYFYLWQQSVQYFYLNIWYLDVISHEGNNQLNKKNSLINSDFNYALENLSSPYHQPVTFTCALI